MSNIPSDLRYAETHEWVRNEGQNHDDDYIVAVGISDHAQCLLGDLVYIELPEIGSCFTDGDEIAVVESVKSASDVYCPLEGEVVEVNSRVENEPQTANADPYGDGWLFRLKVTNIDALEGLLSAEKYQAMTTEES